MLSRNLEKARKAYIKKDVKATKLAHQKHSSQAGEKHQIEEGRYIKSVVYGGLDGIITTFAIVAGVTGAALSSGIVLILGFANLIADGISMAVGDYLSTKAEKEYAHRERERERWEVDHYPEGEKQETVELYMAKGMSEKDARGITNILSKYKKAWVDMMMVNELGIFVQDQSPIKNAIATFLSFAVFGFVPLLSYVIARLIPGLQAQTFVIACILTAIMLFVLGTLKTRITARKWFSSGLEMLVVGGVAAGAAYGIGNLLSRLI